jgi:hypothetical protein
MADTLLDVVKRVLIATGQDPAISAFSNTDDTNYLVQQVNEALLKLRALKSTHLDNNATITVTASTRLYSVVTGLDVYDIDSTSFRVDTNSIQLVTLESLKRRDTEYDTRTAPKIESIYYENGQIGVYPVLQAGATSQTLKYRHPDVWTRLAATTDVFPYPDPYWITYCERYAQFNYELFKGLGNPVATQLLLDDAWGMCQARSIASDNHRMRNYRRYSR